MCNNGETSRTGPSTPYGGSIKLLQKKKSHIKVVSPKYILIKTHTQIEKIA